MKLYMTAQKKMTFQYRWLLNRADRMERYGCIYTYLSSSRLTDWSGEIDSLSFSSSSSFFPSDLSSSNDSFPFFFPFFFFFFLDFGGVDSTADALSSLSVFWSSWSSPAASSPFLESSTKTLIPASWKTYSAC